MSKPSPATIATLRFLAQSIESKAPYEVGSAINHVVIANGGKGIGQHGSRYASAGHIANAPLSSLHKRGWVRTSTRDDGLSGAAWRITAEGRKALRDLEPDAHILTKHETGRDVQTGVWSGSWWCSCGEIGQVFAEPGQRFIEGTKIEASFRIHVLES